MRMIQTNDNKIRFRTQVLVQLFAYINFIINVLIFIPYGSITHTRKEILFLKYA